MRPLHSEVLSGVVHIHHIIHDIHPIRAGEVVLDSVNSSHVDGDSPVALGVVRGSRHLGAHVNGTAASTAGLTLCERCHEYSVEGGVEVARVDAARALAKATTAVLGHLSEHHDAGRTAGSNANVWKARRRRGFFATLERVVAPAAQRPAIAWSTGEPSDGKRAGCRKENAAEKQEDVVLESHTADLCS